MKTYKSHFFLIPALVYVSAFGVYPLVYNFLLSLKNVTLITYMGGTSQWTGLSNYIQIFKDDVFQRTFGNTLVFTGLSLLFQFIIGFCWRFFLTALFLLKDCSRALLWFPGFYP
ncbi:MAG: hypothetical protein ACUVQZ_07135 [Candidatus Caldatribacteriaceae bacterium]